MSALTWTNETRKLGDLVPWALTPRQIYSEEARRLKGSYEKFAQPWPVIIGPNGELYDGHQRFKVWGEAFGYDLEVAVRVASRPLTEEERQELVVLAHKGTVAQWDWDMLADWGVEEKLLDWGFSEEELVGIWPEDNALTDDGTGAMNTTLAERFVVPPFSVLDARQGYWQERKRAWIALGIQSEVGRGMTPESGNWRSDYGG